MKIFIGGAWPYVNGELHIGHIAGLIAGDVLARYYRQKGDEVLYVSGSDCHGTPITFKAKKENKDPLDIVNYYHEQIERAFQQLGFSYDRYGKTTDEAHHLFVQELFKELYKNGYIYEKKVEQHYCEECQLYLADRYVLGICPYCGGEIRGDECDDCSRLVHIHEVHETSCALCGTPTKLKKNKHLYFALSKFQNEIRELVKEKEKCWRTNAIKFTERYLDEGLQDRACTRDLDWGIDVPISGYENKKIYIWIENVLGYVSMSQAYCKEKGLNYLDYWHKDADCRSYYIHAKDNIPFHSIIFPSLLLGSHNYKLPDYIISNEYLTLEGKKISTSKNWAVWVNDLLERYDPDTLRYHLIANGPEKKDANFTFNEFILSHNGELLGGFGNFVNRNIAFINKYFDNRIPEAETDKDMIEELTSLYSHVGLLIEKGELKQAIQSIFSFIKKANKYFDEGRPWVTVKEDLKHCKEVIKTSVAIIYNLSNLLYPFLPFGCEKIRNLLKEDHNFLWRYIDIDGGKLIGDASVLYERIDKKQIQEEIKRLREE